MKYFLLLNFNLVQMFELSAQSYYIITYISCQYPKLMLHMHQRFAFKLHIGVSLLLRNIGINEDVSVDIIDFKVSDRLAYKRGAAECLINMQFVS